MSLRLQDEIISILQVTKALRYYSGDYYCIVKNERGKGRSIPGHLQVKGNSHTSYYFIVLLIRKKSMCFS